MRYLVYYFISILLSYILLKLGLKASIRTGNDGPMWFSYIFAAITFIASIVFLVMFIVYLVKLIGAAW